jgi:hypothetical protein
MDNDRATTVRVIKDFQGLYSDFSPEDMPNGATAEQVNLFSLQAGTLQPRLGLKEISLTRLE